jgi:hypothetical protein
MKMSVERDRENKTEQKKTNERVETYMKYISSRVGNHEYIFQK